MFKLIFLCIITINAKVETIKSTEWGLTSNFKFLPKNKQIVYPPGTYFLASEDKFFIYPSDPQELEFAPNSGLTFNDRDNKTSVLNYSIKYVLNPETLPTLY